MTFVPFPLPLKLSLTLIDLNSPCSLSKNFNALKFLDKEHGEFKSIRVSDNFRGKGNGTKVINHLINEAKKLNIKRLSLETGAGDFFLTARKLFIKCGFEPCEPFSNYKKDINSIYMTVLISNK